MLLSTSVARADALRELSTDRPDTTESPYTINAGHVQIESDLVTTAFDSTHRETSLMTLNLKLGITNRVDLQLMLDPYHRVKTDVMSRSGFGDTAIRAKINLWGNNGGGTAACVMPFVGLPTGVSGISAGGVEGGLIFVLGSPAPLGFDVAMMLEADIVRSDDKSAKAAGIVTGTAGHEIVGALSGFGEVAFPIDVDGGIAPEIHGGFTYGIGSNMQLDAGVNVGLTGDHTINPFIGAAIRR